MQETPEIWVRFLGWEDPLEEGMATQLQYSCLENLMNREAWQVRVHGVTQNRMQLSMHAGITELKLFAVSKEILKSNGDQVSIQFCSVQFSHSVVSDSLRLREPQHARLPCPLPTPGVHPNPCPSIW